MLDDVVRELVASAPGPDEDARRAVEARAAEVLRPVGAFERLDVLAAWLAAWQRTSRPHVERPAAIVFAADHGVVEDGVSAYPQDVTAAMFTALREGAATANVVASVVGARVEVIDVGVGRPTANITRAPAMIEERFLSCIDVGRDAVRRSDADILVLGEMGIGNSTAAAAVSCAVFGLRAEDWVGRGAGVDDAGLVRKIDAVDRAMSRVGSVTPMEALRELGGAELVAIAGAAIEARRRSIPVVLDGFIATAAVAPLELASPGALDNCVAGHCSAEPGHGLLLEKLGKPPLLDLGLRLGEGSGALAALPLVRIAAAAVTDVATFAEWGLARG